MDGFINILKPQGPTASDMVVRLRGILKQKKIGHLGTLDPGACGVLHIAVGKGTKLFDFWFLREKNTGHSLPSAKQPILWIPSASLSRKRILCLIKTP